MLEQKEEEEEEKKEEKEQEEEEKEGEQKEDGGGRMEERGASLPTPRYLEAVRPVVSHPFCQSLHYPLRRPS